VKSKLDLPVGEPQPDSRALTSAATDAPLASTVSLHVEAACELGTAIQHLERGDRRSARHHINTAIEKLNEAELE
jgi:Tfp pilus assembly protein PilF